MATVVGRNESCEGMEVERIKYEREELLKKKKGKRKDLHIDKRVSEFTPPSIVSCHSQ